MSKEVIGSKLRRGGRTAFFELHMKIEFVRVALGQISEISVIRLWYEAL